MPPILAQVFQMLVLIAQPSDRLLICVFPEGFLTYRHNPLLATKNIPLLEHMDSITTPVCLFPVSRNFLPVTPAFEQLEVVLSDMAYGSPHIPFPFPHNFVLDYCGETVL